METILKMLDEPAQMWGIAALISFAALFIFGGIMYCQRKYGWYIEYGLATFLVLFTTASIFASMFTGPCFMINFFFDPIQ
jgi:hypothetical protein